MSNVTTMSETEQGTQKAEKASDDVEIKETAAPVNAEDQSNAVEPEGDEVATPLPLGKIIAGVASAIAVIALVVIAINAMSISSELKKQTCYAQINVTSGPPPVTPGPTASKKEKENAFFAGRKRANQIKACA